MSPRGRSPGDAAERRFFLERTPDEGEPALAAADERHALRVLRLGPGDPLSGLDGAGAEWPLRVVAAGPRELALVVSGAPRRDPAPGEPGSALPWIQLAFPPPRAGRAEELVDHAVQLGAAALAPLVTERSHVASGERSERWERVARESCKQSGRLWLPVIGPRVSVTEFAPPSARVLVFDPRAPRSLSEWLAEHAPGGATAFDRARPLVLVVGPEGGWTEGELDTLAARGAQRLCLSPHILRIETAAEAALAIACEAFFSASRRSFASAETRTPNPPR
ncbi:MAG: RsmE family RNA methyltransferase [Planctomycetota bacterium]